jgi:tRNA A37 methylthiotransferase MiaB
MKAKIGVISLGCAKNRVDTETMLGALSADYEFVQDMEQADIALINTCSFINDAKEESINTILEAEQLKRFGHLKGIIVTGCLTERIHCDGITHVDFASRGDHSIVHLAEQHARRNLQHLLHLDPAPNRDRIQLILFNNVVHDNSQAEYVVQRLLRN